MKCCHCRFCQLMYSMDSMLFWGVSKNARREVLHLAPERTPAPRAYAAATLEQSLQDRQFEEVD